MLMQTRPFSISACGFVRMINVTVGISANFPSHATLFTELLSFVFSFCSCVFTSSLKNSGQNVKIKFYSHFSKKASVKQRLLAIPFNVYFMAIHCLFLPLLLIQSSFFIVRHVQFTKLCKKSSSSSSNDKQKFCWILWTFMYFLLLSHRMFDA